MRLLIASPLYPPEPGGPATYAKLLADGLPQKGVDVSLVLFRDVRSYPKLVRHLVYLYRTWKAARKSDVVLALDPVSTGLPARVAALLAGKPFVVKVVGDYAWEQGRQRFNIGESLDEFLTTTNVPVPVALMRAIESWVARTARFVIVPSGYLKGIVSTWGVDAERIRVIPNAIELGEIGTVLGSASAMERPRIVTVGRLVPWKNVDGIIEAVAALETGTLTIVGEGPEEARLKELARSALSGRACFTGALAREDTLAVMKEADVIVLNSSYEGLSHVLIEALALASAIVATDAGGNPETLGGGRGGLLVPVGDKEALIKALGQALLPEQNERLRQGARVHAAEFSVSGMLERTKAALESYI